MAKKSKSIKNDNNLVLACVYLIVFTILLLAVFYNSTIFKQINFLLGFGIYGLIILLLYQCLYHFKLIRESISPFQFIAQLLLTIVLIGFGYTFPNRTENGNFQCQVMDLFLLKKTCNLPFLIGNPIVDVFGRPAAQIILIVLILILLPVSLSISYEFIHGFIEGFLSIVKYIANIFASLTKFIIDYIRYLIDENNRKRENRKLQDEIDNEEYSKDIHIQSESKTSNAKNNISKENIDEEELESNTNELTNENHSKIPNEINIFTNESNLSTEASETDALISVNGPEYPNWQLPSMKLLDKYEIPKVDKSDIKSNAEKITNTYRSFGMGVEVINAIIGPTVTQYQLKVSTGVSVRGIITRQPDVSLALGVNGIRIEPISGQSLIGLEVPNKQRIKVSFLEIMEELKRKYKDFKLGCVLGKAIDNSPVMFDLQKMPHVLVAGTTGSGKSVLTNSIIMSLLMTKSPDELRLILVDPKKVEFSDYNNIPHLLTPVIVENDKVMNAIKWAVDEMEKRYTILSNCRVRNIEAYNEKAGFSAMPYIAIIIDEVADLMGTIGKTFEAEVLRLAQKARATGIHLVLATQRPSVDVITGVLKGNIPGRIALKVASQQDSRVILDRNGAETLVGYGDMLFGDPGKAQPNRIQGVWVDQKEVHRVVDYVISQVPVEKIGTNYKTEVIETKSEEAFDGEIPIGKATDGLNEDDKLLIEALKVIMQSNKFSVSMLQTYLRLGFNRAARLKMLMEEKGFITPSALKTNQYDLDKEKINEYLNSVSQETTTSLENNFNE